MKNIQQEKYYLQYLKTLKEEISFLQTNVNHSKLYQVIHTCIKNQAKFSFLLKKFTPSLCIITTYLLLVGHDIIGVPFIKNTIKKPNYLRHEYSSTGNQINVNTTHQVYQANQNYLDNATFYGEWSRNVDNTYSRTVQKYSFKDLNEELAINLLNGHIDLSATDLIKESSSYPETVSELTDELIRENYWQIILYDISTNSFSQVKADQGTIFSAFLSFCLLTIRLLPKKEKIITGLNEIECEYSETNIDNLKRILKNKISNYERLTR